MSSKIDRLTSEQIDLIPAHIEKWKYIALSTERLDRDRAEQAIDSAYELKSISKQLELINSTQSTDLKGSISSLKTVY